MPLIIQVKEALQGGRRREIKKENIRLKSSFAQDLMPAMASFPLFLVLVVVLASPWAVLSQETGPECFEPGQCTNSLNVEEWTGVPVRNGIIAPKKRRSIAYCFQQGGKY